MIGAAAAVGDGELPFGIVVDLADGRIHAADDDPAADGEFKLAAVKMITDQKLAGVVMMAEQALTLGLALLLLVRIALRSRSARSLTPDPA